jgi:hypothetical protein
VDDKGDDDSPAKLIPTWKASHITAIPLEPEVDDDPTAPLPLADDTTLPAGMLLGYVTAPLP